MDDRLHGADLAVPRKQRQARPDDGFPGQIPVLLGHLAAGAKPAAGSDDDGGNRGAHSNSN
jgi:hypothetical protein